MRIIYNKIIPFGKNFYAINLFGVLFAKGPCSKRVINHESIHTAQIIENAGVFFYVFYVLEWIVRLIQYGSFLKAYRNISFEREAYCNDKDFNYLKTRKFWNFLKYMRKSNFEQYKTTKL